MAEINDIKFDDEQEAVTMFLKELTATLGYNALNIPNECQFEPDVLPDLSRWWYE